MFNLFTRFSHDVINPKRSCGQTRPFSEGQTEQTTIIRAMDYWTVTYVTVLVPALSIASATISSLLLASLFCFFDLLHFPNLFFFIMLHYYLLLSPRCCLFNKQVEGLEVGIVTNCSKAENWLFSPSKHHKHTIFNYTAIHYAHVQQKCVFEETKPFYVIIFSSTTAAHLCQKTIFCYII